MCPMFVSFTGQRDNLHSWGWVVVNCDPIRSSKNIEELCDAIAKARGYDPKSFVILSFQRLEE